MVLPKPFTTSSPVVASYDYLDLDEGTGTVVYYANINSQNSGTVLSRTSFAGPGYRATATSYGAGCTWELSPFNTPKIVSGTAYVQAYIEQATDLDTVTIKITHYDGTTETTLGEVTGPGNSGTEAYTLTTIPLTEKLFTAGDILKVYLKTKAANRIDFTTHEMKVLIPFKLDI